jgi:hypothetical protein
MPPPNPVLGPRAIIPHLNDAVEVRGQGPRVRVKGW